MLILACNYYGSVATFVEDHVFETESSFFGNLHFTMLGLTHGASRTNRLTDCEGL